MDVATAQESEKLPTWQRIMLLGIGLGGIALFGIAWSLKPDPRGFGTHQQLGLPPCSFYFMFEIPCPSCGGTTSFSHFVRGEWVPSINANPAVFAVAMVTAAAIPWSLFCSWRGELYLIQQPSIFFTWILFAISLFATLVWVCRILVN